ncbi:hypothetical protein LJR044_002481 [Microbacterium foliorum]
MPSSVIVELPFDWVGSVVVPVAAILISTFIAVIAMRRERARGDADRVRAQASELIRALNRVGRAYAARDMSALNDANAIYEQELNAFAAQLDRHDVVVAKFVCIIANKADDEALEDSSRTMLWLATAIELWLRRQLSSDDFARNMPRDTTSWVERIELGQWQMVLKGEPVIGIADVPATDR